MKNYKPTSAGRRQASSIEYGKLLTTQDPYKALTRGRNARGGRNRFGRITTRHQGGGHKKLLRDVDFVFDKKDIPFVINSVEYDPNRSGFISLVTYKDGEKRYILVPQTLTVGEECIVSEKAPIKIGNRLPLKNIPVGTFVYNIEIQKGAGGKIARSAGNYAEVLAKDAGYVDLKMPSSEVRKIREDAWASVGEVSNPENRLVLIGKAGRSRWMGIRPTVRGRAMNPVDHPLGGGEGRARGRRKRVKSLWGKSIGRGEKTRTPKKYSNKHIVSRRRTGKKKEN